MKLNSKFSLALIALVGIGVFALPATTALFSGQHSFYNIDATGNQIPCTKCHGDVKAELTSNANTDPTKGPLTPGPHANFKCEYCHRIEAGRASGDNAYAEIYYSGDRNNYRYLIITLPDLEAHNYPNSISSSGSTVLLATGGWKFINNDTGTNYATISPPLSAPNQTLYPTLNLTEVQEFPLYYTTNGTPLDSIATTQNSAFYPARVNWTQTSDKTATPNFDYAGSRTVNPGTKYHAASLVSCLECHGGEKPEMSTLGNDDHHSRLGLNSTTDCSNCHYGGGSGVLPGDTGVRWYFLAAGGFGLGTNTVAQNPYVARDMGPNQTDTGELEAHKAWVTTNDGLSRFSTLNGTLMAGANNDACIACHTHIAVEINFSKGYLLGFNAIENAQGNYSVNNFNIQGTVNITTYGNASGNTFAVSNSTYAWTPVNGTLYMDNATSGIVVLGPSQNGGTSTNDSRAALIGGN